MLLPIMNRRMMTRPTPSRVHEVSDPVMEVLGSFLVAPTPIDSFDDVVPIDVGFKVPLEHERGTTYAFSFDCYDELLTKVDAEQGTVTVVYDFKSAKVLDVTPDRPDLAVSGRWIFYPFGPRSLSECWKERGDDFYTMGSVVYSWHGGRENVDSVSAADTIGRRISDEEFEALAFQVMRKLSVVAEK